MIVVGQGLEASPFSGPLFQILNIRVFASQGRLLY